VSVEVAAGAVVVLGGAGVGVAGEDLGVAQRNAGVEGVGDRGVPQRVRADVPWDAGGFSDPGNHPVGIGRSIGWPETGRRTSGPQVRCPPQASRTRRTGTVSGMVAGLLPQGYPSEPTSFRQGVSRQGRLARGRSKLGG